MTTQAEAAAAVGLVKAAITYARMIDEVAATIHERPASVKRSSAVQLAATQLAATRLAAAREALLHAALGYADSVSEIESAS